MSAAYTSLTPLSAVITRLTSDLVGTYASAAYAVNVSTSEMPSESDTLPIIVVSSTAQTGQDGTGHDSVIYEIRVTGIIPRQRGTATLDTTMGRVYGNSTPTGNVAGDYGLQRWRPTITGFAAGYVRFVSAETTGDADYFYSVSVFTLEINRV